MAALIGCLSEELNWEKTAVSFADARAQSLKQPIANVFYGDTNEKRTGLWD